MKQPIKLFWWKKVPNFGDAISAMLVAQLSGRPVEWAPPIKAEMFCVGSLMFQVRVGSLRRGDHPPPLVWGTGAMGPLKPDFVEKADIRLVRGPFTATLLGLDLTNFGDPGLLSSDLLDAPLEPDGKIGIVLHHTQVGQSQLRQMISSLDNVVLIDPRKDPLDVIRRIGECKFILSSSLHGVIVADALGVPNTWIVPDGIHGAARLKFYDYAASIGRLLPAPVPLEDLSEFVRAGVFPEITWSEGVAERQQDLRNCFPSELLI